MRPILRISCNLLFVIQNRYILVARRDLHAHFYIELMRSRTEIDPQILVQPPP
jgi:hypothetical protein